MRNLLIAVATAVGVAGLVSVFVFALLAVIRMVERKRKPQIDPYQTIWGDGARPRMTGDYPAGVDVRYPEPEDEVWGRENVRYPEPADQQHDRGDPTSDPEWPGKVKRRAL